MSILLGALGGGADAALKSMEQQDRIAAEAALTDRKQNAELDRQRTLELFKNQLQKSALQEKYAMAFGGSPASGGSSVPGMNVIQSSGDQSQSAAPAGAIPIQAIAERTGVSPDAIRADLALNDGKGLSAMIEKQFGPDIQVVDGYVIDRKKVKAGTFLPGVRTSANGQTSVVDVGEDGKPVVTVPKGAAEAYGTYKGIDAGVAAATKPIKVYNPATQREEYVSEADALKAAGGQSPQAQPSPSSPYKVSPQEQAARDADAMMIKRSELKKAQSQLTDAESRGDKEAIDRLRGDVIALGREITKSEMQAQRAPAQTAEKTAQSGALAAGPSVGEKAAAEALPEVNKDFITKSYRPTMDALPAAQRSIESVRSARAAMEAMGKTGFTAETRAKLSSVAVGLGFNLTQANMMAQNAEKFKSEVSNHIFQVLKQQAGVQTESDANRAADTFAKIGNTTEANRFILDMAEAVATRDVMKARFYSQMMPEAKRTGDYSAIDRLWAESAPSVFTFPTMKRWGVSQ